MKLIVNKGLEQIQPPKDIREWEAGEPHQEKKTMTTKALPAKGAEGGHLTPPKEYREGGATKKKEYADPNNYKYPIDTEEHVRAAISYFSKPKNAGVYGTKEQSAIWARIRRAAKKFGVSLSPESGPPSVEKSTMKATALLMVDNLIKACSKKGVRLVPEMGMEKAGEEKKQQPADKPPFESVRAEAPKQVKNPIATPGSGSHFRFSLGKSETEKAYLGKVNIGKEGATYSGSGTMPAGTKVGQGPTSAMATESAQAAGKPTSPAGSAPLKPAGATPPPVPSSIKVATSGGGTTGGGGPDVLTSASATPKAKPKDPGWSPGQTISGQSIASNPQKKVASMTKSAIELLKGMIAKATSPGNPANENGPVHSTPHGGSGPAQTSVSGREFPGNESQEAGPVHGAAFAGREGNENGPVHGTPHGGRGPAQTSVHGFDGPGNDSQMNKGSGALEGAVHEPSGKPLTSKHAAGYETAMADHKRGRDLGSMKPHPSDHPEWAAGYRQAVGHIKAGKISKAVGARAVPRMPRAMAMAMDTWRSATRVLTRGNSAFAQQVGTGPLQGEVLESLDGPAFENVTRHGPVLKSCETCGRTYTLQKSDDGCPTCSRLPYSNMAKSRGGYLIPSSIRD